MFSSNSFEVTLGLMASSPLPVVDEATAGDHLRANGDVRIGSEAEVVSRPLHVRSSPQSGHSSAH